jgi:DNA-binding response OmpR family regulator
MTKPFDILELIARIEVIKRRVYGTQFQENLIKRGTLEINPTNKQVMNQGEKVLLTPKEFDLLLELVINNNIILTREYLYKAVWDKEFSDESRTLDLHIQRIRNKLFQSGELKTVYGTGYLLEISE